MTGFGGEGFNSLSEEDPKSTYSSNGEIFYVRKFVNTRREREDCFCFMKIMRDLKSWMTFFGRKITLKVILGFFVIYALNFKVPRIILVLKVHIQICPKIYINDPRGHTLKFRAQLKNILSTV